MAQRSFRAFPKNSDKSLNKDRVKELYLLNPHFEWSKFCSENKFNPDLKHNFPFKKWQREWIRRRVHEQDQMLIPRALELRKSSRQSRLESLEDHFVITSGLRHLLAELVAREVVKATSGELPSSKELLCLATIEKQIQSCELQGLLLGANQISSDSGFDALPMDEQEDNEGTSRQGFVMQIMGRGEMTIPELVQEVSHWYDPPMMPDTSSTIATAESNWNRETME